MGIDKMTDIESTKFKIRIDDESPETQFQEEIEDPQLEKLNKRITRISILIPCLIGVIILVAYFDLKKDIFKINRTGAKGVQTLYKQQENMEEILTNKIASLEKTNASLQSNLKEATTAIMYIRSARKIDNKKTASAIAAINKTLTSIPNDLENITSSIKDFDHKFSKGLANLSQTVDKVKDDLLKIQADIASLSTAKVDKKALDLALKNQRKIFRQALRQLRSDLEDIKTAPSSQPAPKPVPEAKPAKEAVTPKPGTIVEQDIK
jgi:Tfp pilus assembly protein PilE